MNLMERKSLQQSRYRERIVNKDLCGEGLFYMPSTHKFFILKKLGYWFVLKDNLLKH